VATIEGGGGNFIPIANPGGSGFGPFAITVRPDIIAKAVAKPKPKPHRVVVKPKAKPKPKPKPRPSVTYHPPVATHTTAPKPVTNVGSSRTVAGGNTTPKPVATATHTTLGLTTSTEVIIVGVGLFVLAIIILRGRKRR
jgi:hypothetical protein